VEVRLHFPMCGGQGQFYLRLCMYTLAKGGQNAIRDVISKSRNQRTRVSTDSSFIRSHTKKCDAGVRYVVESASHFSCRDVSISFILVKGNCRAAWQVKLKIICVYATRLFIKDKSKYLLGKIDFNFTLFIQIFLKD
jgi:hypothetical protein